MLFMDPKGHYENLLLLQLLECSGLATEKEDGHRTRAGVAEARHDDAGFKARLVELVER